MSTATMIIWVLVFLGIFYFMAIRPQRRQRQAHDDMVSMLKRGDEIVTIGGLFGTVTRIGDEWIELAISNRAQTRVRLLKRAISSVTTLSDDDVDGEEIIDIDDEEVLDAEVAGETGGESVEGEATVEEVERGAPA